MAGDDGRIPLPKDDKIPTSKEFLGKVFFFSMIVALLLGVVTVDSCFNNAEKTAVRAQQTKYDGMMVEIDGERWKQTTFYDDNKRCWKIYVHTDSRGKAVFATPCVEVK